jgi:hypothetical protein
MTPQEQQMIDSLISRIRNTHVTDKDVDAEQHLQQGLAGYPDAVYVLAQTVLVQQYGLQQAQTQIQALQSQIAELRQHASSSGGGSFLSHLFGGGSGSSGSTQQAQQPPQQPPYQPVSNPGYPPQYAAPAAAPVYAQPAGYAPAGGGFLRNAMQTAAGVAAGEMAFAGMESLFHGFGGGGGYGGGFGGGGFGGEGRPEEVINNYYGGDDRGGDDRGRDDIGRDNASFSDSQGGSGLQDASYVNDDSNAIDPNDNGVNDINDASYNDDSSFDNSGGDDSGDGGDFGGSNDVSF